MHPYSDDIIYPDCNGTGMRSLDKPTDLFAVITICRHSLHQGVMAIMLKVGDRHRGEGGAGGASAPPLFWLIKLLFQFFSKVLHKKVHRVILCQTCGPQRKHCFFLIAPFRSNIVFWRFSWCLSRQFAEFLVRSRRLDFRLPSNEFQAPVYIFASSWNGVSRRH